MVGKKVVRFPITYSQRKTNQMGAGYVPCVVSDRWLQFPSESAGHYDEGEFISVSVMTLGSDEKPKKPCDLAVTREDLVRAMSSVKDPRGN